MKRLFHVASRVDREIKNCGLKRGKVILYSCKGGNFIMKSKISNY